MSRVLVTYFSRTGTCRQVAELLAGRPDWKVAEIVDAVPGRSYMSALLDSLLRRQPRIRYDGPHPGDFDLVLLVFPVWAGRLAGPMRSFLARWQPNLRRVALVPVMGGRGARGAAAEAALLLQRPPVAVEAVLQRAVTDGSCRSRLTAFAAKLDRAVGNASTARRATAMPRAA
jgi:hypothetical protein